MRALLAWLALAAGCDSYAARSMHSAPGVTDLSVPMARENGDPARTEPPRDPGAETLAVFVVPYVGGGMGRYDSPKGAGEAGLELRFEHSTHGLLSPRAFALTAGFAAVQWGDSHGTHPGALFAQVNYRFLASYWPIDVGIGPAFYASHPDLGVQATANLAGLCFVHVRYLAHTGWEAIAGFSLPVPFFFERSR